MNKLNVIQTDRTFIHDCVADKRDATIVKSIINIAKSLNLKVVAEGIESIEHD